MVAELMLSPVIVILSEYLTYRECQDSLPCQSTDELPDGKRDRTISSAGRKAPVTQEVEKRQQTLSNDEHVLPQVRAAFEPYPRSAEWARHFPAYRLAHRHHSSKVLFAGIRR